jgi:glutamate-1-semialdehyde aminotransferase
MDYNNIIQKTVHPTLNNLPIIFNRAKGAFLYDINNKKYIDFMNGKGALILGHNPEKLNSEIVDFIILGSDVRSGFTEVIFNLGNQIKEVLPYNKIGYFKTGTEAVKAAVFCAKTFNNKKIILSSGYHGYDPFWYFLGKLGKANKYGIIDFFFDLSLLEKLLERYKTEISAIIISPDPLYLKKEWFAKLKVLLKENKDILLIVDEVKVGFRYNFGLYVHNYGINPDIAIISKSIANGFPISILVGNNEFMQGCNALNYTCFFDSIAFFVASQVITILSEKNFYKKLNQTSMNTIEIINNLLQQFELPIIIKHNGSIFQFIFPDERTSNIFFNKCPEYGLVFYPGDNQCISYAFEDEKLTIDLIQNFTNLFEDIKKTGYFNKNKKPNLEWEIKTAWNLMDGFPDIEIPYKLKNRVFKELMT